MKPFFLNFECCQVRDQFAFHLYRMIQLNWIFVFFLDHKQNWFHKILTFQIIDCHESRFLNMNFHKEFSHCIVLGCSTFILFRFVLFCFLLFYCAVGEVLRELLFRWCFFISLSRHLSFNINFVRFYSL